MSEEYLSPEDLAASLCKAWGLAAENVSAPSSYAVRIAPLNQFEIACPFEQAWTIKQLLREVGVSPEITIDDGRERARSRMNERVLKIHIPYQALATGFSNLAWRHAEEIKTIFATDPGVLRTLSRQAGRTRARFRAESLG